MTHWSPVALSAMHCKHLELGATIVEADGWRRPAHYTSAGAELDAIRQRAGLVDISPVGKLSLQGDELDSMPAGQFPDLEPLRVGAVVRQEIDTPNGIINAMIARLAEDEALIITGPNHAWPIEQMFPEQPHRCAHVVDITSAMAGVRIIGPMALEVVQSVTDLDTRCGSFPDMSCAQARVAELYSIILRIDRGALSSYELYFGREFAEYLWDALMEAGQPIGLAPAGLEAMALLEQGS